MSTVSMVSKSRQGKGRNFSPKMGKQALTKAIQKKPATAIQLPEENPHVASAMLRYLYSASYSYPTNVEHAFTIPIPAEMLFHLHLYALANTLLVDPLKALAQARFQEVVEQFWNTDVFPETIKRVYEITTPGAGDQLRSIVVRIAAEHGKELLAMGGHFGMMMGEVAEFGKDVFQVMAGGAKPLPPLVTERMVTYRCPVCPFEFFAKAIEREDITCSSCGVASKESEWRAKKKENVVEAMVNGTAEVNGNDAEHFNGDRVAESESMEAPKEDQTNAEEVEPENMANGIEEKTNGIATEMNGANEKEATTEVKSHEPEETEIAIEATQNGVEAKQNGTEAEKKEEKEDEVETKSNGVGANGSGAETNTIVTNGNGHATDAKENGGEIKETAAMLKKKAKKARKALNAANTLANGPTSPRATEAQIVGNVVNGR
jgi:hypothetical protein